ncbi:glycosyltransferase family 4 protein [Fuscovulum ytuae]|uniref:Glycosyltransferase family 4 protein n=1 Tax=Fuscovulum ytuae TaxID=3042299 RepID=A0ABY8Q4X5_9RHOB|nr:glycosyltransferase family 4 protein [Fuscovulum sp. YMD61]WGV15928.1 glycosyltransferase family 4 protein [Fuscovulum sp. YMD61]
MLRLGFLSNHNPFDKNAFSSTAHFMWRALSENPSCSLQVLGKHRRPRPIIDRFWRKAANAALLDPSVLDRFDAIVSLVSTNLVVKYGPLTHVPIIHCTDATPGFLKEFYGYDIPDTAIENERRAYDCAKIILFSSDFMRKRALAEFGELYAPKMMSLPWGANLETFPTVPPTKPPPNPLRLLFIGKDWARKGGDIAVATTDELNRRGIATELHLVGTNAGSIGRGTTVVDHGYLNKNLRKDRLILEHLLNRSHFLLLPTRADCTPMVLAEANSYGIPVLTTNVGGIPSIVQEGRNGEMVSPDANAADYADRLIALSSDQTEYEALSRSSFEHFRQHLTWSAWSDAIIGMLEKRYTQ